MTKPGVQKPHCSAKLLTNASWIGCSVPSLRQPLDRRHVAPVGLNREHQARLHERAVHEHRAGAAFADDAADVRAGQPELLAQKVHEQRSRLDLALARFAVDGQRDRMLHHNTPRLVRKTPAAVECAAAGSNKPVDERPRHQRHSRRPAPATARDTASRYTSAKSGTVTSAPSSQSITKKAAIQPTAPTATRAREAVAKTSDRRRLSGSASIHQGYGGRRAPGVRLAAGRERRASRHATKATQDRAGERAERRRCGTAMRAPG